jgi:hypothetical protein
MGQSQRATVRTPLERRALACAETMAEASGLRWQSGQLPGLARILIAFAEREHVIASRAEKLTPQPEEA